MRGQAIESEPKRHSGTREALGLSQTELAALLGVHPMTVSRWERGVLKPTPYQRALLEAFYRACWVSGVRDVSVMLVEAGALGVLRYLLNEGAP